MVDPQQTKNFCEKFYDNNMHLFVNKDGSQKPKPTTKRWLFKMVLSNPYNVLQGIYKQAFPECPHNKKHISHGVFSKNLHDPVWLKNFMENKSVLILAKPDDYNKKCRLVFLNRKIFSYQDLKKDEFKADKKNLKKAGIGFGDVQWSIKNLKSGKYYWQKDDKQFYRKYK